jgi:hypothetical protein
MTDRQPILGRRTLLGGAATAGAAVAAATLLPAQPVPSPDTQAGATPPVPGQPAGGYQLTEHVKQYYASARI